MIAFIKFGVVLAIFAFFGYLLFWDNTPGQKQATGTAPLPVQEAQAEVPEKKYVGKVHVFRDWMSTNYDNPTSTIASVLEKLRDFEAGIISDKDEIISWIESAQAEVHSHGLIMKKEEIPEGLPESLAADLQKYKDLVVQANDARADVLDVYHQALSGQDADTGRVAELSAIVQEKIKKSVELFDQIVQSARTLERQ